MPIYIKHSKLFSVNWAPKRATPHSRSGVRDGLDPALRCYKSPALKVKTFSGRNIRFRENAYLFRKFQAIFVRKTFTCYKPYKLRGNSCIPRKLY